MAEYETLKNRIKHILIKNHCLKIDSLIEQIEDDFSIPKEEVGEAIGELEKENYIRCDSTFGVVVWKRYRVIDIHNHPFKAIYDNQKEQELSTEEVEKLLNEYENEWVEEHE